MKENEKRNQYITKLVATKRLSYAVIAEMTGSARHVVAGVAFRRRHLGKVKGFSPNGYGPNKIGHGYQPPTYQPAKTAANTR